ncbi:MAG: 33-cGAMP-specific phosphodiesterase 2 [Moraxellaceae bacterium]|jgi:hypothetical protein|nr:33-cGAMP-specific phosphodiesterase 2 [Moraxellaceae bacterium]
MELPHRYDFSRSVHATAPQVFEYLDDPLRLGAHMGRSSWMMAGSKMAYELDAGEGRATGSHIRMTGTMLGQHLALDEVVTCHQPPAAKQWRTTGHPRLLIIGHYAMGFTIQPAKESCRLTVFIHYSLPTGPWRLAGWLLAGFYTRWCVRSMVRDAVRHFSAPPR